MFRLVLYKIKKSGSGFVNRKSTLNRDESILCFLHFVFEIGFIRIHLSNVTDQISFGWIGFPVQKLPVSAADQISYPSLTI